MAPLSDDARAALKRLAAHLPKEKDLTLIVLKGHLLIERQMRDIIRTRAVPSEVAKIDRWSFSALTRVTRAYVRREDTTESLDDLWESVDLLNALRNELAHRLDSRKVNALITRFVGLQAGADPFELKRKPVELQMKMTIMFLVGRLMTLQK